MNGQGRGNPDVSKECEQWITLTILFLEDYEVHAKKAIDSTRACIAISDMPQFHEQLRYWGDVLRAIRWLKHHTPLWGAKHIVGEDDNESRQSGPRDLPFVQRIVADVKPRIYTEGDIRPDTEGQ